MRAAEEASYELDGILGGGKADALRRSGQACEHCARREAVFAADEGFEALEREGEVGAALVVGDGVDFVDDDGADAGEIGAGFAGREQDVERLGGGDEDVRRTLEHGDAVFGGGVAGADAGADFGGEEAAFEGKLLNFAQGAVEVFLHVVRERLEGADVEDFGGGAEGAGDGLAEERVDGDEEGGEGLAGTGGGGDEGGVAGEDGRPAGLLGFGGGAEFGDEPLLHDGVRPGEGCGGGGLGWC